MYLCLGGMFGDDDDDDLDDDEDIFKEFAIDESDDEGMILLLFLDTLASIL